MMTHSNVSQTLSRIIAEEKRFGHEYFSAEKFLDPASSRLCGLLAFKSFPSRNDDPLKCLPDIIADHCGGEEI